MAATRSLNKAMLIGNLTRDPELRYTPSGTAVCSFGLATNRDWVDSSGQKQEEATFHNIVAWNKLAEICDQILYKGRKVYVEGRISTRDWTAQDGQQKRSTEVVIEEMVAFGPGKPGGADEGNDDFIATSSDDLGDLVDADMEQSVEEEKPKKETKAKKEEEVVEETEGEDIPF